MPYKVEASQPLVVNVGVSEGSDGFFAPFVFGVAGFAVTGTWENAVQTGVVSPLLGDLHVAVLAAGIDDAVDRSVTVTAFPFELGVGDMAVDLLSMAVHGRQRTGTQKGCFMAMNAADNSDPDRDEHHQGDVGSGCKYLFDQPHRSLLVG